MIFTSYEFVLFFAVVLGIRRWLGTLSAEKWFLLAASLAFYVSWNFPSVVLILFTALSDYLITRKMGQTSDPGSRRRLLVTSLILNLGLLGFFKYANFFLGNLGALLDVLGWSVGPLHFNTLLPPGISFYVFASISYVMDVYYGRIPVCTRARDYALFITFFPKVLSGPIVRARELLPQFADRVRATTDDIEVGLLYVLLGAVKKLVIADQIAPHVNLIFSAPTEYDGLTLLLGVLGYTVQIYCDFSGYTDMAIGFARMLGYRLPENFRMPYSSANITEFWRRWHITMSQWFRDYLFVPLEIATRYNPSPRLRVSLNMMLTMLLCGLWHGPSWNFVIWGGIHGAALTVHKLWTTWNPLEDFLKNRQWFHFIWTGFSHGLTLSVVVLNMIFFRSTSFADAGAYLQHLLLWSNGGIRLVSPYILSAVVAVILVHLVVDKDRNLVEELPRMSVSARTLSYSSLLLVLVLFGATDSETFIYFQF